MHLYYANKCNFDINCKNLISEQYWTSENPQIKNRKIGNMHLYYAKKYNFDINCIHQFYQFLKDKPDFFI